MIDLILISFIVTYLISTSGFITSVKYFIWKKYIKVGDYKTLSFKPFDCPLCMTFWTGLAYLLITSTLSLETLAGLCLASYLTSPMEDLQNWIKDTATTAVNILYTFITPKH